MRGRQFGGPAWTGYLTGVGVLMLVGVVAYLCVGAALAPRQAIDRTQHTLALLSEVRGELADAQRGEQTFAFTADEHYLQPYTDAAAQLPASLAALRGSVGDGAAQQATVDALDAAATGAVQDLGRAVTMIRTNGAVGVSPVVLGTAGTELLANARQHLDVLQGEQIAQLRAQQQRAADETATATAAVVGAALLGFLLLTARAWWSARSTTVPAASVDAAPSVVADELWHAPLRVLLAEDEQVNQQVAQFMLGKLGHRVDTVANGLEAVQALRTTEYDVVLMDVQMPVLDGLDATRLIRADLPADRQPHIIAMTASVRVEDRTACRAAGMNDYLSKPIRCPELTAALTPLLLTGSDEPAAEAESPVAGADRGADIRARMADISDGEPTGAERQLLARLLTSFNRRMPGGIDELAGHITAGDVTAVQHQAHALKGSATNIGVTGLAHLFAEVEANARVGHLPAGPDTVRAIRAEFGLTAPVCEDIAHQLATTG
ncbi:response regulator [Actinoplanes missouriensis]|uniref:response regulator n=1 Tax=Actinoplanes missouriensis TaxID=1866 RepID=UPI0002DEDD9C|nr:response regulator [Actinoplanes missouriensis]